MYLAEKYGKDDSLYPKDVKKRALVNQRLFFDMGTLYQRFGDLYVSTLVQPTKPKNAFALKKSGSPKFVYNSWRELFSIPEAFF